MSPVMRPSSPITAGAGRSWSRPISKSIGSWPGVTLSAPVPNVALDALVGDHRHVATDHRHDHVLADRVAVALVVGMHRDGDVGEDRRRPHGRDRHGARSPSTSG